MREHWCFVDSKPSDQLLFQNMSFVCWFIECWDTEMCLGYFPWNLFLFSFPEWLVLLLQSTALSLSQIPNSASYCVFLGFPGGASGKEPACWCRDIRDLGSVPGSGRSPGGGHGNPLQYSFLANPLDRGAWRAIVHGVTKSQTQLEHLTTYILLSSLFQF